MATLLFHFNSSLIHMFDEIHLMGASIFHSAEDDADLKVNNNKSQSISFHHKHMG